MTRARQVAVALGAGVLTAWAAGAQEADWPQWRGPGRNGVAPDCPPLLDKLPAAALQPAWEFALPSGGPRYSSPVIAGGQVFLNIALDAVKG
jgi:hypothetical protein